MSYAVFGGPYKFTCIVCKEGGVNTAAPNQVVHKRCRNAYLAAKRNKFGRPKSKNERNSTTVCPISAATRGGARYESITGPPVKIPGDNE